MSKISSFIRSMVLASIVVVASFICGIKLLQTQLVDGGDYLQMTRVTKTVDQDIDAARGQIVDCKGEVLNTNKITYNVNLQGMSLVEGTENTIVYRILSVLKKNGEEWNDSLPITKTQPYEFLPDSEDEISLLKRKLNVGSYATVDNCIYQLYKMYEIGDKYDEEMRRAIAGVRYEMTLKDFSDSNEFVLASDIGEGAVMELKELSALLTGVDITESWEREYKNGKLAPHVRGLVGSISEEEFDRLKDSGYLLNDIIGTEGVEQALESELRGTRGVRTITRNSDGLELRDEVTKEPIAGNSVMLTIDSKFQQNLQDLLKYHIDYLNSPYFTSAYNYTGYGKGCKSGSVVVLNVKDGGVLGIASYPNYDLNDASNNYMKVLNGANMPMFNRALMGEYRPGSTFKTITATAGLAENVIQGDETIYCAHTYTYYSPGFSPTCLGWHGALNVRGGLRNSCNIYFYETARRLGIDKLAEWAGKFGVGKDLGFELDMARGQMSSIELYEEKGYEWHEGDIVQAGIGQCETLMTPMHLAVQAMTLANKGVRYEPHIVKSVYNYDFSEKLYDKETVIAEDFSKLPGMSEHMEDVKEGMRLVASEQVSFTIDGAGFVNTFDYVGIGGKNVAVKTGTPQTSENEYNSALIGFYPADNPEIAFAIILEAGEYSKVMAGNVVKAYATGEISTNYDEKHIPKTIL